ncbi:MAG: dipicolinate synthase subunit B [Firmicutes bacterium]|nr:dipicolinate synthase subunit B [Bacillota bacterium]
MSLAGKRIGFALTGSHCTLEEVMPQVQRLVDAGAEVVPILSESVDRTDTRFGPAQKWKDELFRITGKRPFATIVEAETVGPKKLLDALVIAPCTGNTIAKLANAITDGPVLMAAKAQLRNRRPVVIAVSTNDGLSNNARNIGMLLNMRNIYLVPFGQDSPREKQASLVARMELIMETVSEALEGRQIQPILVGAG